MGTPGGKPDAERRREILSPVKMRLLLAGLAVGALALAGCSSKVGVAATYDGHSITDSQVAQYITAKVQPVSQQDSSGAVTQIPARTFVLNVMLQDRLYDKVLGRLPGGHPSESSIQAQIQSELQGHSPDEVARSRGLFGFTEPFIDLFVRDLVINNTLTNLVQQGSVDPNKLLKNLHFDVTVSPRYGTWDPSTFSINGTGGAGAPSFVTLHTRGQQAAQ